MKQNNFFEQKRNHYFYGKLLTVRDFELEQNYFNNKRRLINRLINGAGVISGLEVVNVDERTISLENGVALDYHGREICVNTPTLLKVNLIEGFDTLEDGKRAYLYISYDEIYKEAVHSVVQGSDVDEQKSYNMIQESYRLQVTNKKPRIEKLGLEALIENRQLIIETDDIIIHHILPTYVSLKGETELVVEIEKKNSDKKLDIAYVIESNYFKFDNNSNQLTIKFNEKEKSYNNRYILQYKLKADVVTECIGDITVLKDNFHVNIGEDLVPLTSNIVQQTLITDKDIKDKIIEEYYNLSLEELIENSQEQQIYLASFIVFKNLDSYIIEDLERMPFNQYVYSNNLNKIIDKVKIKNTKESKEVGSITEKDVKKIVDNQLINIEQNKTNIAHGTTYVDIGLNPKSGKTYFSGELIHGLGEGNVYISVSIESEDEGIGYGRQLVFGDQSIFKDTNYELTSPNCSIGTLAYVEKGSFRVGVKLLENTNLNRIKVTWWAFKHDDKVDIKRSLIGEVQTTITVLPDTVNIVPKEKIRFTANIEGCLNKDCIWSIREKNGGNIDVNGLYEAPAAEGVYEIVAQSAQYPSKEASAYVIVKA